LRDAQQLRDRGWQHRSFGFDGCGVERLQARGIEVRHVREPSTLGRMTPWQEVGERCYRRRYESFDLNIGVVQGSDGLLLFDTRCHAREAGELLDELRVFGTRPIRWVVNSHWHFDHTFGNATIRDATIRDATIRVAPSLGSRHRLEIWGHRVMRDELLRWSEDARSRWTAQRPDWEADFAAVEIVPPDHLVDDAAVIDLGDRAVALRHFGPAHTGGDLVAFVDDTVFVGDLVEESAPPAYGGDCHPFDWPKSNAAMLDQIPADATVVPGHGDVVDRAFVARQLGDLTSVAVLIRELHADGVDAGAALAAGRGRWPFPEEDLVEGVERGYAVLDGDTTA
jgi:glyoxylase-like metal-dependent hydrolase (beta-lactamase superfamily II)